MWLDADSILVGSTPDQAAGRVNHHLTFGSTFQAAKVLEALPHPPPSAATVACITASTPPIRPQASTPALVIEVSLCERMLVHLRRGLAPGLPGWTYDHLRATTSTFPTTNKAILELINLFVSSRLLDLTALHASALTALEKPGGWGVQPIAVGKIWLHISGLGTMASCLGAGLVLALL
jgi:hypothetical protein